MPWRRNDAIALFHASIFDMLRLADATLDAARLHQLHFGTHEQNALELFFDMASERVHFLEGVGECLGAQLYMHGHAIKARLVVDDDAVMGRDPCNSRENVFDLAGKDVRSADDEHVVGTRTHLLHACGRTTARARLGHDAC